MSNREHVYVDGLRISRKQTAPDFVIVNIGIKVDDFKNWLTKYQKEEWVNIDIKLSREGNYYAELDTYKKDEKVEQKEIVEEPIIEYPEEEKTEDIF